nr:unnamed protein product [Callosobruchus chinensis]
MECDIVHVLINTKKKKLEMEIHHPHDWYQLAMCYHLHGETCSYSLQSKRRKIIMECSRGQRIALMAINKQNESVPETINVEGDTSVLQTIDTNSMNCSEPSTEDEYLYQNAPIVLTTKNHQQVSQNPIDMPLFDIETIPVVLVAENNEIILDEALAESYLDSNSNAMITMEKTIIMECSRGQRIALMAINKQNESVPETINVEGDTSVLQTIDTNSMNCSEPSTEDEYLYQNAPIVLTTKNHQQVSQNPIDMPLFDIETIPVVYLDSNGNAIITMKKTVNLYAASNRTL